MRGFDWQDLWVPTWPPWEVALRATIIYGLVVGLFRLLGRKELGRTTTHGIVLLFLVTTAVRQSIVGTDTSVTTAFIALVTIMGWDALASRLARRSRRAANVIDGPVRRLVSDGQVDDGELRRAGISRDELVAVLRRKGRDDLAAVTDAYLERSGRVTFILERGGAGRGRR